MSGHHRNRAIVRALTIWRLLQARRWTLHQLAAEVQAHPRTVRRMIYALEESGCAVRNAHLDGVSNDRSVWWIG